MKNLLLAAIVTVFCCPNGKADNIIYSNNFSLGTAVNISGTAPTVANTFAGGISGAHWLDIDGTNNTHGPLLANGSDTCAQIDYWALPFTPTNGFVYLLTVNMTFTNNPGVAPEIGFSQNFTTNYASDARFNGSANGYDWMALTESSGNVQFFAGAKTANTVVSVNGIFPANTASTNTYQIVLNTEGTLWSVAGFCNGVEAGSVFTYTANPTGLLSVGMSQNGVPTVPTAIQYNTFALTTTQQPFIVKQPTAATTLGGGSSYTNSVTVMVDTNGGTLSYQWFANGLPLTNGVNNVLSGANTNVLVINPIATVNQLTNYFVIVSNSFGSATSSFASLTVLTNVAITAPASLTNAVTLFTGAGSIVGASPTFSVTAIGAPPLIYRWLTNGVLVAGATNNSLSFTNLQSGAPASYTCIVSNSFGSTNVLWNATYLSAPTAAYPQAVLGDIPLELWRLNEADDGLGNLGAISHDYNSGNNGVYTNVTLAQTGYDSLEPSETAMAVTAAGNQPSAVLQIGNLDLAATMPNGVNAEFSVEAWSDCISGNGATGGAPVISQGTFGTSSFFLGVDTNATTKHYQFYVRNAAGTTFSADDTTVQANDVNWHYLVGVCDEAHSNISLYIDGHLAAKTAITTNSGLFESGFPMAIGAGIRTGSATYNVPFTGSIDDVAIYNHALSSGQVINHYAATGGTVPVAIVAPLPPTTFPYLANQTLTIPATISGSGPFGYSWINVTTGGPAIASGSTSGSGSLDATLTIPNASSGLSGDQLELVVTNATSSANAFVTLFNPTSVTLDASSPILYSNAFNGGTWSIIGMPLTAANALVGGTSTTWTNAEGTNNTSGGVQANGTPSALPFDSWLLPFTPHPGYIYTLSAAMTFTGNPGNWVGLGFAQIIPTNAPAAAGRLADTPNTAYDWQILTESTGNVQYFAGANGNGTIISSNGYFTAGLGSHTESLVLDTTSNQWKYFSVVDGKTSLTNTYGSGTPTGALTNNPTIGAVGFEQNTFSPAGAQAFVQWTSFTLTQVAPGGVPPYLISPLPPTNNITLSNGTVALSATAFGSAPFGYTWINNSTVVASGSTSSMEPLAANLSVPSSSLSLGQLQLVVTNAFGTNITSIALVSPINPNPGRIQSLLSGNQLTLSWPTNLGWILQTQTNAPTRGITTNWVNVANSSATNQVVFPIVSTNGSVFYRLVHP